MTKIRLYALYVLATWVYAASDFGVNLLLEIMSRRTERKG